MLPILCLLVLLPPQGLREAGPVARIAHPDRLLLRVAPDHQQRPIGSLHPELGMRELWNLPQIGWRAVELAPGRRDQARAMLEADPAVLAVHLDTPRVLQGGPPNDPLFVDQWHLERIDAPAAWSTELGDPSVVVAVIDTGIELTHPDLAANLWVNPGEIPGNLIDDDGNGYVDDVHGYDFANFDSDPSDDHSHGTACAGLVAAVQDNGIGGSGVAPGCRVVAVKAGLGSGFFYASANVPALVYCADMGFQVASMSFYSDEVVPAERDAIAYCWEKGVLPIVAAGNDNSVLPFYPAAYPQTLAVGATFDALDNRAFFSNWGSWVNVSAPGWSLTTTTLGGGYTAGFNGTSGATPHVAGVAALLFSASPGATNASVRAAIEDAALLLVQAPYGPWSNYGRVNADLALERILGLTVGSVPARMNFAAPCGGRRGKSARKSLGWGVIADPLPPLEVHGVGLEAPNTVEVLSGGTSLSLLTQERQSVRTRFPLHPKAAFELRCNGALVQSWVWEPGPGLLYAATDGSTKDTSGAQAQGAWSELYRKDGALFTCTENSSGLIYAEFVVRRVSATDFNRITLEFERAYDDLLGGAIETVELYDWESGGYPYGSWITLSSGPAPGAGMTNLTLDLPGDPASIRDEEGSFYIRVTTTNAGPAGMLRADMLRLRVR